MHPLVRALVLAALPLGCASTTTQGPLGSVSAVAADVLLPPAQEEKLGDQLRARIERDLALHKDADVQRYIDRLGARLVSAARARGAVPRGIDFDFHVVDDDEQVNAFAIPGGHVYLMSGLLLQAESEHEVAAVLAHEIGHVTERHPAKRLVAAYGLSALASLALGQNAGLLEQLAAQVIGTGVLLKYTRDQERQADAVAIRYLVRAGYDPGGLVVFFERMAKKAGSVPGVAALLATHPLPRERVAQARAIIDSLELTGDVPTYVGRREYARIRDEV